MDISIASENAPFFNTLDYIVIAVVLLSGLLALVRGFVREFLSLCAWVGAYFAAITFYEPVMPLVEPHFSNEKAVQWIAIGIVFLAALILLSIVGYFLSGLVKGKVFVWADRSAGFLYGLLRGVVVLCLIYLCAVLLVWSNITNYEPHAQYDQKDKNRPPELLLNARSRTMLHYGADIIVQIFPQDVIDDWIRDTQGSKTDITASVKEQIEKVQEHIEEVKEHIDNTIEELKKDDDELEERQDSE